MQKRSASSRISTGLGLAVALTLGSAGLWQLVHDSYAERRRETVLLPSLGAELLTLDAGAIVRRGSTRVLAVRFGAPVEFVPHHFKTEELLAPQSAEVWAKHLNAPLVFNAGQFDENLDYLGWLKADDRWLSAQRKSAWQGLLVSGPKDRSVWGRVVDLEDAEATVVDRYRHVVQSMMLVDADRRIRVRDTDITASRCVVAEDRRGRLMVILVEGAVTLADLARWLPTSSLGVVRAMNLDGGIESQLVVTTPELTLSAYGQYGTNTTVWNPGAGPMRYPLPVIIAVRRVPSPDSPEVPRVH